MEFIVRECPNNGILGGPFEKTITAYIGQQHSLAEISIEQFGERIITVHTVEDASIYDLHHLYFDLKRLIMLMDGQFYPITSVTQDGVEITTSITQPVLTSLCGKDIIDKWLAGLTKVNAHELDLTNSHMEVICWLTVSWPKYSTWLLRSNRSFLSFI